MTMTLENSYQFNNLLTFYGELGLNVIPLNAPGSGKDPKAPAIPTWRKYQSKLSTAWEHDMWWKYSDVPRNLGVLTGAISGNLIVVDIDDEDSYKQIADSDSRFRDTLICKSGRGYHLYFFSLDSEIHRTVTFRLNDKTHHIKGEGSYVVAPPSTHANGKRYSFLSQDSPAFADHKLLIQDLQKAGGVFTTADNDRKDRPVNWASSLVDIIPDGARNTSAAQLCGLFIRHFPHDPDFVEGMMEAWNAYYCKPPLPKQELSTLVQGEYRRYGPSKVN